MRRRTNDPEGGASVVTGYILNIGIATMVLALLLLNLQGTVGQVEDSASQTQLELIAESVATNIVRADRLGRLDNDTDGTLRLSIPDQVADNVYNVHIENDSVNVSAGTGSASATFNTSTEVHPAEFGGGGDRIINYNATDIVIQ